jgi:hypothetical protein
MFLYWRTYSYTQMRQTLFRDCYAGLIRRTTPFSCLLQHTRGCGESTLTRILVFGYNVSSITMNILSKLVYAPKIEDRENIVFILSVILSFCHLSKTLTLAITFEWYVHCTGTLIFHMSSPCEKIFPWVPHFFHLMALTLVFDLL